ncbi:hypothetical protein [Maricaulis maris]|uniref:hypothetical protein n=1 Tax=Maricaulis maris TaxID=74318 RepID=UPI0012319DB6|nr:hypothetical protein [Maricaulis maris]
MSETIVLRQSTDKLLAMAVGCLAGIGACAWALVNLHTGNLVENVESIRRGWFAYWLLWAGLPFLGVGCWVFAKDGMAAARGRASLTLDEVGFQEQTTGRDRRLCWNQVSPFEVYTKRRFGVPAVSMVVFDVLDQPADWWSGMNRNVAGRGAWLQQSYELPPQELADLLNKYRDAALSDKLESVGKCEPA